MADDEHDRGDKEDSGSGQEWQVEGVGVEGVVGVEGGVARRVGWVLGGDEGFVEWL